MPLKTTRRNAFKRDKMARTEKELRAESGGSRKKARKFVLPVKVAKITEKRRDDFAMPIAAVSPSGDSAGANSAGAKFAPKLDERELVRLVERQKRFIILAGVTFFMVVFAALWALSLNANLRASRAELAAKGDGQGLDSLAGELGQELDRIKGELDKAALPEDGFPKSEAVLDGLPAASSTPLIAGTSTISEAGTSTLITPEVVEKLKEKLE